MPLEGSPILAYCPGPVLPIDHTQVVIRGTGHQYARATVAAEFMIDGKLAGPGNDNKIVKPDLSGHSKEYQKMFSILKIT